MVGLLLLLLGGWVVGASLLSKWREFARFMSMAGLA